MSFQYPYLVIVAAVVGLGLGLAYRWLNGRRTSRLAAAGLRHTGPRLAGFRRHVPPLLFLAALVLLLLAVARPQATVPVPRAAGTVILAFDVSNSMATSSRILDASWRACSPRAVKVAGPPACRSNRG